MTGKNVKGFRVIGRNLQEVLDREATKVPGIDEYDIYNYKGNTLVSQRDSLVIAGGIEVSVNYAVLQLSHEGIKLEEVV